MKHGRRYASFATTVAGMYDHQQGHHGWYVLYQALQVLVRERCHELVTLLEDCWDQRPVISDPHLVTLLGIGIRELGSHSSDIDRLFDAEEDTAKRASVLLSILDEHGADLAALVSSASNSFTGARRFVVPQMIIGAFAQSRGLDNVRSLDLGTGLGLLPRQLNNRNLFDRFIGDLACPAGLGFAQIPLTKRHGVDVYPLPTLEWVRSCFGPSAYYQARYDELLWSLDESAHCTDLVTLDPLDLLDYQELGNYIRDHEFNAVTCSFVLYQYGDEVRSEIIGTIVRNMPNPGLFLSMEPSHGLLQSGCAVLAYEAGSRVPLHVADITDGHFLGEMIAGPGLWRAITGGAMAKVGPDR